MEEPLIMHRILSFLTTEEAAKTSLLSKAWLEAWRTRPTLEFNDENLFRTQTKKLAANLSYSAGLRAHERIVKKFSRYIRKTMRRYSDRKLRINTLRFSVVLGYISKSVIRESIRIAIENNVRTLDIYFPCNFIELGEDVFGGGESIVNLILCECSLRTVSIDQIRCHNIQKLDFYMVCLDELMFENIIHSCPLLKLLRIGRVRRVGEEDGDPYSDGPPVFRVKKHANLQRIDFELLTFQTLLLGELPRLESMACTNEQTYLDSLPDVSVPGDSEDWMPCFLGLQSPRYQNMNTLMLFAVGTGDDFFNNFAYMFPNVEKLSIQYCYNLRILKLSSPSIKRIELRYNKELKEAHFDGPRITYFKLWSLLELTPEVSFTAISGVCVSSLVLDCLYGFGGPNLWLQKLKDLLSALHQSEIYLIISFPKIPEFNVDEIRNVFVSSKPIMVQELSVSFCFPAKESMSSTLPILDCMFWVCRPRIIREWSSGILCMELLYKTLVLKHTQDESRFWQIDLKDVQVGTFKSNVARGFGRGSCMFFHSPTVYELLEMGDSVLDWKGFLVLSSNIAGAMGIFFKFEWRGLQNETVNGSHQIGLALQND